MIILFNCIAVCAIREGKKIGSQLPLMRVIFVFFSRLKMEYVKLWRCRKSLWRCRKNQLEKKQTG